jgi:hypothetical protein
MTQIYLLGDVCRRLNVPHYRVSYALLTGLLPEPAERLGGKRVFTEEDVRVIAEHFGVRLSASSGGEAQR